MFEFNIEIFKIRILANYSNDKVAQLVQNFSITGKFLSQKRKGNGNVNDTIVVEIENHEGVKKFTLQRINHNVFNDPRGLMEN